MVQRTFDGLRSWDGDQSRAFEELAFQLLKSDVPAGSRAIRTGNPDGGVEWYAVTQDGVEWGWQAKHVSGIDALLTAMTESVRRVAKERPRLRTLTFVISWNLATSTRGGERKSQRQKYEDKVKTWRREIKGVDAIEFELVQGSDLLDRLAQPTHRGRAWFWFDELVLGPDWLTRRYDEEADAASQKYRPDLQVDIPIQDEIVSLGFGTPVLDRLDELARAVVSAAADVRLLAGGLDEETASLCRVADEAVAELKQVVKNLVVRVDEWDSTLAELTSRLAASQDAVWRLEERERDLQRAWTDSPAGERGKEPPTLAHAYGVQSLLSAAGELEEWLVQGPGRLLSGVPYLLTGRAGSGKTHLLLDATRRALDDGRPAVFLSGARFGASDLWASIADQLGLPSLGADELLGAMDAAGEAASIEGRRFLIMIDALNETTPPEFWVTHLPALRARVARYNHVALVVSCRDTYRAVVVDGAEQTRFFVRSHPGFAEREVEAAERYFRHYGLEAPRLPLLTPEFTLPLFLRLYCESLSGLPPDEQPTGHQGRIAIFNRYLGAKVRTVSRRIGPGATSAYELERADRRVRRAIDALLDEMSRTGHEGLAVDAAEASVREALGPAGGDPVRLLGLLQEEGILSRERLYLDGHRGVDAVRVVFQAFSDHLILTRRVELSSDPLADEELRAWLLSESSWGITEAATVFFPERYGIELPDLLSVHLQETADTGGDEAWESQVRTENLFRSLVENLPYRDPSAISDRTVALLNEAQQHLSREAFYGVLVTMAPQLGNRLDGEALHRYLSSMRMPIRDSDFGFATYHALDDAYGPFARLARWAAAGPYPAYDPEVVERACVPLCWLFSSPCRYQRDWVTKALVQLLHGHLDVATALVERFWSVDDPYVVQRVIAVAYGALLRSAAADRDAAGRLAVRVHTLVVTPPVHPDELLLDSARGIVRWAVGSGLLAPSALKTASRPYGLTVPGPPPLVASLEQRYGVHEDRPTNASYTSIYYSLFELGDFGRYVVESGLHHFSRFRTGEVRPERTPRGPRFVRKRWETFVRSLSEAQAADLADQMQASDPSALGTPRWLRTLGDDPLSGAQRDLLRDVWVYPPWVDDDYPVERARRWIFRRTLSLGWTPELFGATDRGLGRSSGGREGHKAERWGKKYQWMAYHELLARVADNYQSTSRYDESEVYEGLHQIAGEREIDPSLPPVPYETFAARRLVNGGAWGPSPVAFPEWPTDRVDFRAYDSNISRFLEDRRTEPTPRTSVWLADARGDEWIVLDGWTRHNDPYADKSWRGLFQQVRVDTLLVPATQADALLEQLSTEATYRRVGERATFNGHTDCCYVGEIGRVGPRCHQRHDALEPLDLDGRSFELVSPIEGYTWEGSILDCSIEDSASTVLPSTFVQQEARLTFETAGPSWSLPNGQPVFVYLETPDTDGRALLVRASFLAGFLRERGLALVILHDLERSELKEDYPRDEPHPWLHVSTAALLGAELKVRLGPMLRTGTERQTGRD